VFNQWTLGAISEADVRLHDASSTTHFDMLALASKKDIERANPMSAAP
jgi:hypothetical protein